MANFTSSEGNVVYYYSCDDDDETMAVTRISNQNKPRLKISFFN